MVKELSLRAALSFLSWVFFQGEDGFWRGQLKDDHSSLSTPYPSSCRVCSPRADVGSNYHTHGAGCFLCLERENPTWISGKNSEREQSEASNTSEWRFLHAQMVSGEKSGTRWLQFQLEYSCSFVSTQQGTAQGWGQDSGAVRQQPHKQKSMDCHDEQMLLLPPQIYSVSSASQRAVVSSDGQLGRIASIC